MREVSLKYREEIDRLEREGQELKVKRAEMAVVIENLKSESERMNKENENMMRQLKDMQAEHKQEVKDLEEQLSIKIEENDTRLKKSMDEAIKCHETEAMAQ